MHPLNDAEEGRLRDARIGTAPWKKWGPYLSERPSRAYRWGEDGLAGISDDRQFLCFALALWNGRDPILKERLFGLTKGGINNFIVPQQRDAVSAVWMARPRTSSSAAARSSGPRFPLTPKAPST